MNENEQKDILDQVDALEKASEAPTLPPLKINKTRTLKMQYFALARVGLDFNFLYRFQEPVETAWVSDRIPFKYLVDGTPIDDKLKEFGLAKWEETVKSEGPLPPEIQWLQDVDKCSVTECEIVEKYE